MKVKKNKKKRPFVFLNFIMTIILFIAIYILQSILLDNVPFHRVNIIDINIIEKPIILKKKKTENKFIKIKTDMDIAIKQFEKYINNKIKLVFNPPIVYNKENFCIVDIRLSTGVYTIIKCESDSFFKREIYLSLKKIKKIKRYMHNGLNLKNKKIEIKIKIN